MNSSPSFTFLPSTSTTAPDLHTTLSTLKHIIQLSKTTLHSISSLLPFNAGAGASASAAACPYNSGHCVPPTSLFRHHLQCPSSPAPIDLTLLQSLHYPKSLQSAHSLANQNNNCFTQILPTDANADLCFSLDDYHTSLDPNFFYRDYPAVVTFPHDDNTPDRMLTLPVVLSAECANFKGDGNDDMSDAIDELLNSCYLVELLPSEYWSVRTEINQWNDYPSFYSYIVLRSIVCSYMSHKEFLIEWVVVNSPFYGVVIDGFMRDHILLLFRLCFKAIVREATAYLVRREPTEGKCYFECPVLIRVLMWLASQLAILYGEVNGKLFAINMLKQHLLIGSSKSLFLSTEQRVSESTGLSEVVPLKGSKENGQSTIGMVFVSQVAAAVAALHERSAFEARIKAIRSSRSVPVYQRVQEHGYISKKAEEERQKRSNYRPIIGHDGVLWQRGGSQDNNKNKSREELLAEERDYKRRRMSYRGKKMKRSTTQVMRDIIDEYMEEIKQANMSSQPHEDAYADNNSSMVIPNSSKASKGVPQVHSKDSSSDLKVRSARSENEIKERDEQHQKYYSRSHDHRERDEQKSSIKYYRSSPDRRHSRSDSRQWSKYRNERSSSVVRNEFEDRYDPSKSHENDED